MNEELKNFRTQALEQIQACATPEDVESFDIRVFGRKGSVRAYYDRLRQVPDAEKPELGKQLNALREELTAALDLRRQAIASGTHDQSQPRADITLPGRRYRLGTTHPITQTIRRIVDTFRSLGFGIAQGPDIELERYNFDALNMPDYHSARDMHDTFYAAPGVVLRTHTSNVQIRTMLGQKPPVRIVAPGRCYRNDTIDATHSPIFHQVEGLYVDERVAFTDLKATLAHFARVFFGADVRVRFRTGYFPFTEPSAEYDFSCVLCGGKGCRVCKGTGWIEISGAGMVAPAVFRNVGYDPEKYTGFAFGMGVERIAMLCHGIDDIRLFYDNELEFLEQF